MSDDAKFILASASSGLVLPGVVQVVDQGIAEQRISAGKAS